AIQGKRSCYAAGSSSHYRQSDEDEHVEFDNTHFIVPLQHARFYSLDERQNCPEKIFTLNPQGDYQYFMDDMKKREWGGELFSYKKRVASKKWLLDLVSETLDLTPNHVFFNASNQPVHFKRCDMNTKAQFYATLFLYNIKTKSHTSTIPIYTARLLHYMIKWWKIDVAQVISNEIRRITISGHSHGNKAPMTLGFLALITGLCRKAGVDIPNVATKRISSIMNEDYVLR
ncbi:hypothetical protein RYX36_013301, partial [Vicia faba]